MIQTNKLFTNIMKPYYWHRGGQIGPGRTMPCSGLMMSTCFETSGPWHLVNLDPIILWYGASRVTRSRPAAPVA